MIKDFKKTNLAEDVNVFFYRDPKSILFITDYNESKDKGDLWLYNGGEKNIKIDDNVNYVIVY